jgi:MerR family copper efflux transcriptional regulator
MRIGELAKRCGVSVQTLRFYERKGLLPEPPRRLSGYRDYPPEAEKLVRFIRTAKTFGFSLHEIRELLGLQRRSWATCADICAFVARKLEQIEARIRELQESRRMLSQLLEHCPGRGPLADCTILRTLAPGDSTSAGRA